jgi:adenylate cyclase class 2
MIETEIKLFVPDRQAALSQIETAGAVLVSPRVYEHNLRYENAVGNLTSHGIVLRLRQDTRARLTYKEPLPIQSHDGVMMRAEVEVTVDDFEKMDVILKRLGFHPYIVYEKYRTTYHLGETEVVLDEMPYGDFIEIEGPAPAIESALAALGWQDTPRFLGSYMELFALVKTTLGLEFHDLTFANFEGITVPPEIFRRYRSEH